MIPGVGQRKYKIRSKHLVVLEIKEMLKKSLRAYWKDLMANLKELLMLEQFEQQNENDNIGF